MDQGAGDPAPLLDVHAEAARDESAALFPLDAWGPADARGEDVPDAVG